MHLSLQHAPCQAPPEPVLPPAASTLPPLRAPLPALPLPAPCPPGPSLRTPSPVQNALHGNAVAVVGSRRGFAPLTLAKAVNATGYSVYDLWQGSNSSGPWLSQSQAPCPAYPVPPTLPRIP